MDRAMVVIPAPFSVVDIVECILFTFYQGLVEWRTPNALPVTSITIITQGKLEEKGQEFGGFRKSSKDQTKRTSIFD